MASKPSEFPETLGNPFDGQPAGPCPLSELTVVLAQAVQTPPETQLSTDGPNTVETAERSPSEKDLLPQFQTPPDNTLWTPADQQESLPDPAKKQEDSPPGAFVPHGVVRGVVILLVLTGLQRGIGFARSVWFCRHLSPEELGKWDVLFSFLNLAAPFVIFSLPGTFGRYAERYRRLGQLRSFLRETALVCAGLTIAAGLLFWWGRQWVALLLFGAPMSGEVMGFLPWTLASIIMLNYLTELFTSLRNARISSVLFFWNSLLFAAVGVGLLAFWRNDVVGVTTAYGISNLAAAGMGLWILRRNWIRLPPESAPMDPAELWRRLAPFALGVWTINLATNVVSIVDRYLLVHLSPGGAETALALVGQYHSSRLLPLLLLSVMEMLRTMLLPYMSTEWEAGRQDQAGRRLNLALKLLAFSMTGAGALCVSLGSLLFETALGGKFQAGQQILPGTLICCIWFGLASTMQNYLWCAEKASLVAAALGVGLMMNVGLNCWLVPRWGLEGVVAGTSISYLFLLGMMLFWARRLGFHADKGLIPMMLLPAVLLLGPWWTWTILLLVGLAGLFSDRLLTNDEKQLLHQALAGPRRWLCWWPFSSSPTRLPEQWP